MKIMIDKDVDVGLSYTTLNFGKLVIDIPNSEATKIIEGVFDSVGVKPLLPLLIVDDIETIMEAFNFEDVMNYYGVSKVCEWCEANR